MTQPRSRVDLYAAIRRDARSGMSNRALQRKHGVGFRTVTAALESAWPKERDTYCRRSVVAGPAGTAGLRDHVQAKRRMKARISTSIPMERP